MSEDATEQVRNVLKEWVTLDDQERALKLQIKQIRDKKAQNSEHILKFMRDNSVDDFKLEGQGSLSRSVRTSRPALSRDKIRTQLLIQFADQPQRVAEALRSIEGGGGQDGDDTPPIGTQRELLVRRVPRKP
jgi:predicted  nucleic acid-binding Zn-ribbon protein